MDLRTRYTALVTLTTQHVKYISDALRRLEEEEVSLEAGYTVNLYSISYLHFYNEMLALVMQKQVEEERQARVGQVSDLLGWVKGLQERAAGPAEMSIPAQQV